MKNRIRWKKQIFTIPNILSMLRLAMIPLFVWLYCVRHHDRATALVLVLSGITDILDGVIARRFDMVSDLGKILDPVADKLTQGVMMLCLCTRFRWMLLPVVLMAGKELIAAITGAMVISQTGEVRGAELHGKVSTWALYIMMTAHVLWPGMSPMISGLLIAVCVGLMIYSMVCYGVRNTVLIHRSKGRKFSS